MYIEKGGAMRKLSKEEIMLQEIYGYTDEQLLEEARLAELELEEHEEYRMSDQEIEESFQRLMKKIKILNEK